jgi:hypothetical protein
MIPYSSISEVQNLSCILCINFSELFHAAGQLSVEVEGVMICRRLKGHYVKF